MPTIITGSGSCVPPTVRKNESFLNQHFFDESRQLILNDGAEVITKFQQITGISERRYANDDMNASGMAVIAGKEAIEDAGIDKETIDQLIVAHNFGDVLSNTSQSDLVPSLASRVKNRLGIKNPSCVAYDILFGCPGWLQGVIQADAFTRAEMSKTCLVIGTEALSRVMDPYDRDSMIYSDGAGAIVTQLSAKSNSGILGTSAASFASEDVDYIFMGGSNNAEKNGSANYLKMQGRKVYEFALKNVPIAIKTCLDNSNVNLSEVQKIFIHQANEKMDEAIVKRLFKLYDLPVDTHKVMPMNISMLGNSSVATIPTLFNMVKKGLLENHSLAMGDIIVFASVGAGMNINAVCYRV